MAVTKYLLVFYMVFWHTELQWDSQKAIIHVVSVKLFELYYATNINLANIVPRKSKQVTFSWIETPVWYWRRDILKYLDQY